MKPRLIELHLDELVFHGLEVRAVDGVAEGLAQELTRLLSEQSLPLRLTTDGDYANVRGATFVAASGAATNVTGAAIARAVYEGLCTWPSPDSRR